MSQVEFYSYPHVTAIGRRKMVMRGDVVDGVRPKEWEVYVRLVSGSSFIAATSLTRKGSGKVMGQLTTEMAEETGCTFVTTSEAAVVFEHVARVYVDTQENEFVTLLEDSSGASYQLDRGSKAKCQGAVEIVAQAILQYMNQKVSGTP